MRCYTLEVLIDSVEDGSGKSWPGDEVVGFVLEKEFAPLAYPGAVSWLLSWIVASPWYPLKLVRRVEYLKTVESCGIGSLRIGLGGD